MDVEDSAMLSVRNIAALVIACGIAMMAANSVVICLGVQGKHMERVCVMAVQVMPMRRLGGDRPGPHK